MRMAAEELEQEDRIHVINSGNLSTGAGLLVLEAAVMAKEGKSAVEIVERIEGLKEKVRASFVVDTLTYLHRGGRCSIQSLWTRNVRCAFYCTVKHFNMEDSYESKLQKNDFNRFGIFVNFCVLADLRQYHSVDVKKFVWTW